MMEEGMSAPVDDLFSDCGLDDFVQQPESSVPFVGLWNLGNSCFFNSVLQILFYCPGFQKQLEIPKEKLREADVVAADTGNDSRDGKDGKKCKLLLELQNLFAKMRETQNSMLSDDEFGILKDQALRPSELMEVLREVYPIFEPYTQQDAQECLRCILDVLHEALAALIGDVNPQGQNRKSVISDLSCKVFGGRNSGETCLIPKSEGKSQLENRDPSRPALKESRSTAARKRGVREVLKSLSRPKARKRETKYKPLTPLGENKSSRKLTPSEAAALVVGSSVSKSERHDEPQSSHLPPLKKKKLNENNGISKFYKPSAFCNVTNRSNLKLGTNKNIKLARHAVKPVLKPTTSYQKLKAVHSRIESGLEENYPERTMTNFIDDLFQGQLINEVRCLECENRVQRTEDFMDISLPVQETKTCESHSGLQSVVEQPSVQAKMDEEEISHCSVTWGLSSFTSHEILEGENKYYCGKCLRHVEGERRLLLHKLPPVLTLHLKRFSSSKDTALQYGTSVSKISSCLNVPLELSMEKWCTKSEEADLKYTLFGIIVHSGASICSGHYLAYVRITTSVFQCGTGENLREYDGKWLEADDDRMRVLGDEEMEEILSPKDIEGTSRTPYLLFYHKGAT